jgi:hypothetical protein
MNTPKDEKPVAISFFLFNEGWDHFVGNVIGQSGFSLRRKASVFEFIEYLVNAIRSLRDCQTDASFEVTVHLIELSGRGIDGRTLEGILKTAFPDLPYSIEVVGNRVIRSFLDEAAAVPLQRYRSPNRMHEFLVLNTVERCRKEKLLIVDPDITFLARNCISDYFAALDRQPHAWVAGFMESNKLLPVSDGLVVMRDRLHSFALFFKVPEFNRGFTGSFDRSAALMELVNSVRDRSAREYYAKFMKFDTFNMPTEYLKYNFGENRILDLALAGYCREGSSLTLLSEKMLHAKYLEPFAWPSLDEVIGGAPRELALSPGLRRAAAAARISYEAERRTAKAGAF